MALFMKCLESTHSEDVGVVPLLHETKMRASNLKWRLDGPGSHVDMPAQSMAHATCGNASTTGTGSGAELLDSLFKTFAMNAHL